MIESNNEDLQLIELIRSSPHSESAEQALIAKYSGFVRLKSASYFMAGGDQDDLFQEGMIGLIEAIRTVANGYPYREKTFKRFAELLIIRKIITSIKTAARHKHLPLNSYIALSTEIDQDTTLEDILPVSHDEDPLNILINNFEASEVIALAKFGRGIKVVSLIVDETCRFLDGNSNLHKVIYVVSSQAIELQAAIEEFEYLLNYENVSEETFQKFFSKNPDFLLGSDYKRAHPHMVLERDDGSVLIPDFILEPYDQQSLCDLLELKKPSAQPFILKKDRLRFSAQVMEAKAQLREYSNYFDERSNRQTVEQKYGLRAWRPNMITVIGRRREIDSIERKKIELDLPNLRVLTYDEILDRAKRQMDQLRRG